MTAMYRHVWHPYPNASSISKFVKLILLGMSAESAIEYISKSALSTLLVRKSNVSTMCRTQLSKTQCDPWPGQHEPNGGIKSYPPKPAKPFHFIGGRTSPVSAPIRARSHYYTVSLALPQVHSSWTDSSPRKSDQHQHLLW